MTLAKGDMRKVLNVLQSTWMAFKNVTEDTVYTCVGHPLKSDIKNIVHKLLNTGDFKEMYDFLQNMKTAKGLALEDIITEIHLLLHRSKNPMSSYRFLPNLIIFFQWKCLPASSRCSSSSWLRLSKPWLAVPQRILKYRL